MSKRGITPLIATVLLIGFTIALAAIIITWGGQFVRKTQERVGIESELQLSCSQLNFDIDSVSCVRIGGIGVPITTKLDTVRVSSNTAQAISGFILRAQSNRTRLIVVDSAITTPLPPFGAATLTFTTQSPPGWGTEGVGEVQAIPKIISPGQGEQVCSSVIINYRTSVGDGSNCQ